MLDKIIVRLNNLADEALAKEQYSLGYVLSDCVEGLMRHREEIENNEDKSTDNANAEVNE
jgi:hypothetical protein